MLRTIILLSSVLFLGFFAAGQLEASQTIAEDFNKPIPELELLPEKDFEEATNFYTAKPFGEEDLAYEVRLPKDWTKSKAEGQGSFTIDNKILGELDRYYGPVRVGVPRSELSIETLELDYKLTASQWLLQNLLSLGYNIQGVNSYNDESAESLHVYVDRDISYIVRTKAQINGKRIILAKYTMPMDIWKEERVTQAQVVQSFRVINPRVELIEKMRKYQFLDIAEVQYPESWELRAVPLRSIDRIDAKFLNFSKDTGKKKKYLDGKITIYLVSLFDAKDLEDEIEDIKRQQKAQGLILRDRVDTEMEFVLDDAFEFGAFEAYEAVGQADDLLNYEFWLGTMMAGEYYYFITLVTPSRTQDYFTWSKNTQTFKVFANLVRPIEDSLVAE